MTWFDNAQKCAGASTTLFAQNNITTALQHSFILIQDTKFNLITKGSLYYSLLKGFLWLLNFWAFLKPTFSCMKNLRSRTIMFLFLSETLIILHGWFSRTNGTAHLDEVQISGIKTQDLINLSLITSQKTVTATVKIYTPTKSKAHLDSPWIRTVST